MITAGLMLFAFVVGIVGTAWIYDDALTRIRTQRDQARNELAAATWRAAVGATKAEHARAEREARA